MTPWTRSVRPGRARGAAMVEFTVVAPIITLLGLLVLQWALLANARQQIDHATFMAARAGSTGHANPDTMQQAYVRNLLPLYGGGHDSATLARSHARARLETEQFSRLRVLNPTRESFDDWHDSALGQRYGRRAIPQSQLPFRPLTAPGARSGQTLHDANLLKLWVTHGYSLNVPLAGRLIIFLLRWTDDGQDAFFSALLADGRLPLHSHVVLHMQSDALEPEWSASTPGVGPAGPLTPTPGTPGSSERTPPRCLTSGCTVIVSPLPPEVGGPPPLLECLPGSIDCAPLCPVASAVPVVD
jgi:hypothetical protein